MRKNLRSASVNRININRSSSRLKRKRYDHRKASGAPVELLRSDKPIAASRGYFLFVFNALMEFMREVVKHSIRVKVIPNAKRECVEVARDGRFIVSVGVPRAKGLANARM